MCGIVGFVGECTSGYRSLVASMARAIDYRGPDDSGEWVDESARVALGHRRLSILDLSPLGHQPMLSASGKLVTVFNGEIYNFGDIKTELEGHGFSFKGGSDTEVLLAAVEHWGIRAATARFNGMFAFAIWDRENRILHLVRDRLGVKPLFFGWINNTFCFASEVKPLSLLSKRNLQINSHALGSLMTLGFISSHRSIYDGIYKLLPGTILSLPLQKINTPLSEEEMLNELDHYWSLEDLAADAIANPFTGSFDDAVECLEELLIDSVRLRLIADVPVGAFLSGGIDSSAIVAIMQRLSSKKVRTFTIGFDNPDYDERENARAVAAHIGTDHTELCISAKETLDVVPLLPQMFDEPFADSSQIPSYLVAKLARKDVTVTLSGDGGDELFAGYNRYFWPERIWARTRKMPIFARRLFGKMLLRLTPEQWNESYKLMSKFSSRMPALNKAGDKIHKLARVLSCSSQEEIYLRALSHWPNVQELVVSKRVDPFLASCLQPFLGALPLPKSYMLFDQSLYLVDDLLTKADRTSMFVSLEAREPMIDYRIVEFASRLPLHYSVDKKQSKKVLRSVLYKYVPPNLVERPKMGFSVPIGSWLRGGLRDWAEDLLSPTRLKDEGYLNPDLVATKWKEHLSGKQNWEHYLWDVLMFQGWLRSR